jgi:AsmA protein
MARSSSRSRWPRLVTAALVTLVALAVLIGAGLLLLDRVLLARARAAAGELSRSWGRPVEIGGIATKLVPWLGARVTDVRIGAAQGETRPLLELPRAEVHLNLLGALLSRGKDVEVKLAEIQGLRVNVLRLADGTTNLERLARAAAPPEPSPSCASTGPVSPTPASHSSTSRAPAPRRSSSTTSTSPFRTSGPAGRWTWSCAPPSWPSARTSSSTCTRRRCRPRCAPRQIA